MIKIDEEEKEILTDKRKNEDNIEMGGGAAATDKKKKKNKKHKKRRRRSQEGNEKVEDSKENIEAKQKSLINSDQFNINNRYHLIKMLGFGSFGEIHLAYDSQTRSLNAIKFEHITQKNPQLKHEFNILEQLNKNETSNSIEGIPKVYLFDRMENKANFMIMEFLGPALSDLFQFKNKQFSLTTVLLIGIQMLQRIEFIHEKGFLHRDIKPENFVVGLNDKSNTIYTIDYGLSKRYKDKNTGQHIPYRENRHLIGTARYASLNAHLGIEQSRRDDIESIGYVLVYFLAGRLPWQSKHEKAKLPQKIMEKKLVTPPEILCKKLPVEFSHYFHYCKNLKFEDRPDYSTLKSLFYDLLIGQVNITSTSEFVFDWFNDETPFNENKNEEENTQNQTFAGFFINNKQSTFAPNDMKSNHIPELLNENQYNESTPSPDKNTNQRNRKNLFIEDESNDEIILKNNKNKHSNSNSESSDDDTERLGEDKHNNEEDIKNIMKNNSESNKNNSDSNYNYNLLPKSSSEKSSENQKKKENSDKSKNNLDDDIIIRNSNRDSNDFDNNNNNNKDPNEINLIVKKGKNKI